MSGAIRVQGWHKFWERLEGVMEPETGLPICTEHQREIAFCGTCVGDYEARAHKNLRDELSRLRSEAREAARRAEAWRGIVCGLLVSAGHTGQALDGQMAEFDKDAAALAAPDPREPRNQG